MPKTNAFLHGYLAGYMKKEGGVADWPGKAADALSSGSKAVANHLPGMDAAKAGSNLGAKTPNPAVEGLNAGAAKASEGKTSDDGKAAANAIWGTSNVLQSQDAKNLAAVLGTIAGGALGAGAGALTAPKGKKLKHALIGGVAGGALGAGAGYVGPSAAAGVVKNMYSETVKPPPVRALEDMGGLKGILQKIWSGKKAV